MWHMIYRAVKNTLFFFLTILIIFGSADSFAQINNPLTGVSDETIELRKETAHFGYYCRTTDTKCLEGLSGSLEQNYSRITSDLEFEPEQKIKVYIYKDIKTFHEAIEAPFAPDWVVGSAYGDSIKMVSPLNPGKVHNYASFMQTINHEFVHVLLLDISVRTGNALPLWLHEGLASYEARQEYMLDAIHQPVKDGRIPALDSMSGYTSYDEIDENNLYGFSYAMVSYIMDKYGIEALDSYIRTPDSEKAFGIGRSELEKDWNEFLKENY